MNNNILPFEYGGQQVRVIERGGEPWFVAADVTRALGLGNGRDAVSRVDQDGVGKADVIDSIGRAQIAKVLSEPALYELIFQSRVQGAVAFKRFVTREVLPSIRKTGSYSAVTETPEMAMARGLQAAQLMLATKDNVIAELAPKADAWDQMMAKGADLKVDEAAKVLCHVGIDTGRDKLFASMKQLGWVFRGEGGRWKAKQSHVNQGLLRMVPTEYKNKKTDTNVPGAPQVLVKIKGLERLRVLLGQISESTVDAVIHPDVSLFDGI